MRRSFTPIGIDISGRVARAVQLRRGDGGWNIHAAAVIPRLANAANRPEDEAPRIAEVLRRRAFAGTDVVLSLPDERLLTSVIDLPPRSSGAPIAQIAAMEMGRLFKKDPGSLEVALWELPSTARHSGGAQCMALACAHDQSHPLVAAFLAAGLTVRGACPRIVAMARSVTRSLAPPPHATVVLDVGWDRATLIVVCERVVVFERPLEMGEFSRLRDEASARLGVPPEIAELSLERDPCVLGPASPASRMDTQTAGCVAQYARRMAEQVRVSLAYICHRYPAATLGRVILTGEHGGLPGLREQIGALLEIDTVTARPADIARVPESLQSVGESTVAMTAAGLALCDIEVAS